MNVSQAAEEMRRRLVPLLGAGEAKAVMRLIFEEVMNLRPVDVAVNPGRELPEFMPSKLDGIIRRLESGEPVQYILGRARFYGLDLKVTPATLIPRPETEELVDIIVKRRGETPDLKVLDVCTGSGCIAVALSRNLKFPQVSALDLSADALAVARENADTLRTRVNFFRADALTLAANGPDEKWDIIVANPPYVLDSEARDMEPQVLDHEPRTALFVPDSDPMKFYEAILAYARKTGSGAVYFEINPLCAARFEGAEIIKDIHGRDRFAIYDPLR